MRGASTAEFAPFPLSFLAFMVDSVRVKPLGDKGGGDGRYANPAPALVGVLDDLADDKRGQDAGHFDPVARGAERGMGVAEGLACGHVGVIGGRLYGLYCW